MKYQEVENQGNRELQERNSDRRGRDRLQSLNEIKVRYRGLMDAVPDLVFILDKSGLIVEANRAACSYLEYSGDELTGKRFRSFMNSAGPEGHDGNSPGEYGQVSGIHAVLVTKRNGHIPVEMWTTARLDSLGGYAGSLTVARILDGGEAFAERLKLAEQMFQDVSKAMGLGIAITKPDYEIAHQNEYLQTSYPEGVGAKCYRTYRNLDNPCRMCVVREAMFRGETVSEVICTSTPTGEMKYSEMIGVPIKDRSGRVTGGFEIIRDITGLKERIEKIESAGGSQNDVDICALHGEVNQPLSGISGYSELIKKSIATDNPAYRYATKIYEQSQRLTSLIRKIDKKQTIQNNKDVKSPDPKKGEVS